MSKRRNRAIGTPLSQGGGAPITRASSVSATGLGVTLTVTDHASRFVLLCEAMQTTREELALIAFERLIAERGLPLAIRSDNGVPCSPQLKCVGNSVCPVIGISARYRTREQLCPDIPIIPSVLPARESDPNPQLAPWLRAPRKTNSL
jgi:transposase InsO family protein